jgi:hypothetical protein
MMLLLVGSAPMICVGIKRKQGDLFIESRWIITYW